MESTSTAFSAPQTADRIIVAGEPAMLTILEVAQMMRCSTRHVYRLVDAGRMPRPVRLGALVRWSHAAIAEWIAAGCPVIRAIRR
jgi:excisionase family DNA binding protein